ncbi:DUF6138 family protein [Acinetobacter sp. WA-87]|uniref:DUF6138 family protein n=1 Tax=Acinetobacter sp. WA-87 TaxID=3153556 RepID=UPI003262F50C
MLLEKNPELLINDILIGHFELVRKYPNNPKSNVIGAIYLPNYQIELNLHTDLRKLIIYFCANYPFDFSQYLNFFKQLNTIYSKTYTGFESCLSIFIEKFIFPVYFYKEDPNRFSSKWLKKPEVCFKKHDQDILKIFMFGIRCMAYTHSPNYEFKEYLNYIKELNFDLYQELVSHSNSELEIEVITIENLYFKATSNNLLASIDILAFQHNEETYKAVLNYINQLFKNGFPQSHKLKFEVEEIKDQTILGIPCLIDCGANRLFNSAAQYHNLHPEIQTYISLIEKGSGFYTDLDGENYVEVDGFAIFSLIVEDSKYTDQFIKFLNKTNDHCILQNYIPCALLDRQGLTSKTIKTYLNMCEALLEHENFRPEPNSFYTYFNNLAAMKILVQEVNIYRQEQHNIQWPEIFLSLQSYGDIEDCFYEIYAMQKFKSREIWKMYLMLTEDFR